MVDLWRKEWGDTVCKMPFYTVEIAPCASKDGGYNGLSPLLRRAQLKATKIIENCEMVCTNDLVYDYEIVNIHLLVPVLTRLKASGTVGETLSLVILRAPRGFLSFLSNSRFDFLSVPSPRRINKEGVFLGKILEYTIFVELSYKLHTRSIRTEPVRKIPACESWASVCLWEPRKCSVELKVCLRTCRSSL